jgi:hypothetical protein
MVVVGTRRSLTRHVRHGRDIIDGVLRKKYGALSPTPDTPASPALSDIRSTGLHFLSDSRPKPSTNISTYLSRTLERTVLWLLLKAPATRTPLLQNKIATNGVYR